MVACLVVLLRRVFWFCLVHSRFFEKICCGKKSYQRPNFPNKFFKIKNFTKGIFKSITSKVKNIAGGVVLTEEDLLPVLKPFEDTLMNKNVATDVAKMLSEYIRELG